MVEYLSLKDKFFRLVFPSQFKKLELERDLLQRRREVLTSQEGEIENTVNQRVASTLMRIDPFKPVLDKYGGAFGEDFQRPEENLNEQGQMLMFMWGYAQIKDPSFLHFIQWILNTEGNAMVKKGNPTPETILYSRAMIAAPLLMRREVKRLAGRYAEIMAERGGGDFDPVLTVE